MDELTRQERKELAGEQSHMLDNALRSLVQRQEGVWPQLAQVLFAIKESRSFHNPAAGIETFAAYLAQPEIGLSENHATNLISAFKLLHVGKQIPLDELGAVKFTLLRTVLPAIRSGAVDVEEALADCRSMPRSDLRLKYTDGAKEEPDWCTCDCGHRHKSKKPIEGGVSDEGTTPEHGARSRP